MAFFRTFRRPAVSPLVRAAAVLAWLLGAAPAGAAVSIYMTPEALAERATIVAEATVVASASALDPETGTLATYVTLDVDETHRGNIEGGRLVLREPGGSYGGLALELDAVPVYRPGERVFVFLEPARDGSLRTVGMFFGKFSLDEDPETRTRWAVRELDGRGTILRGPDVVEERLPLADLASVAAAVAHRDPAHPRSSGPTRGERGRASRAQSGSGDEPAWLAIPPEYPRLRWDAGSAGAGDVTSTAPAGDRLAAPSASGAQPGTPVPAPAFTPLSATYRSRWSQIDAGSQIVVNIDPTGNPLGDAAAAVGEIERAMAAWNAVPEARLKLATGNTALGYRATHSKSPTASDTHTNIILFDDPYEEISDPVQCAGVLAIGGYWRTSYVTSWVNGIGFYGITQSHVIFNDNFECVLGVPDDLAEVATHELGHALGFGHSSMPDAIMRSTLYRYRGPVLGDDDRDAAHCFYPHTLQLTRPNGGELWTAGKVESIAWEATPESDGDPGTVDLELSIDGGASWLPLAQDEPNDGEYFWTVPPVPSTAARVRVIRPNRTNGAPAPFPSACSKDGSDAQFGIRVEALLAGSVADAGPQAGGIAVTKNADGTLSLSWGPSCSTAATDFAIYEGSLTELRAGRWDHAPVTCTTAGAAAGLLFAGPGDRYFLVSALAGEQEGHLGASSDGALRPPAALACAPREAAQSCGD